MESQLTNSMTGIFQALFADRKMQTAKLTEWLHVQTVGGKTVSEPVLTISCTRAADRQIDWDQVPPAGLKRLCAYSLHRR